MEPPTIRRGFAAGDNAAQAARKNHELGTAHRFKKGEEARTMGHRGWQARVERRVAGDPAESSALHRRVD